jgi:hypothetical protein
VIGDSGKNAVKRSALKKGLMLNPQWEKVPQVAHLKASAIPVCGADLWSAGLRGLRPVK